MARSEADHSAAIAAVERAYPDRTLQGLLRRHARNRGDKPAVTFQGETWTYRELVEKMDKVAGALRAGGLKADDRILYYGKNNAEFAALWGGAAVAGVVLIPVNWRLALAEIVEIGLDAGVRALFLDPEYVKHEAELRQQLPLVHTVIHCDAPGPDGFAEWMGQAEPFAGDPAAEGDNSAVGLQLYTSGTTGRAKGVLLTHDTLFWQRAASEVHGMACDFQRPDDVLLVSLTISHVGGLVTFARAFFSGGHAVVLREFAPGPVLEAVSRYRVSRLTTVPSTLQLLLEHPGVETADVTSVHTIQYGAAPIPVELLQKGIEVFGCQFVQVYGMTESGGTVATLAPEDHTIPTTQRMKSVGRPLPTVEMRIAGSDGQPAAPGEIGEIEVKTRSIMQGYWQMPAATADVFTADLFYKSGDAGYMDEDGYIYLCDRIKDMIVTGAENVYPAEVEHALFSHPDVVEAAVIGVPDERWGEAVKAIVVRRPGGTAGEAELIEHVRSRIARFKAPKSIDFVAELPRNAAGKVLRRKLAEPFWAGRERRIN